MKTREWGQNPRQNSKETRYYQRFCTYWWNIVSLKDLEISKTTKTEV
jgi:hypothetical protein